MVAIDDNIHYPSGDYWAIIQSTDRHSSESIFTGKLSQMFKMEKGFRIVSVSSIHSTVFVLPDRDLTNNTVNSDLYQVHNAILSVKSINDWPDFFIESALENKSQNNVLYEFLQPSSPST